MARCKKPVNQFWHIDETYIKIKGQLHYLYRAIDSNGKTVDFLLTKGLRKLNILKSMVTSLYESKK